MQDDTTEPEPEFDVEQWQADSNEWRREWTRRLALATASAKDLAKLLEAELEAARRGGTVLANYGPSRADMVSDTCSHISALEAYWEGYASLRWPYAD
jgi:hypothetical protein